MSADLDKGGIGAVNKQTEYYFALLEFLFELIVTHSLTCDSSCEVPQPVSLRLVAPISLKSRDGLIRREEFPVSSAIATLGIPRWYSGQGPDDGLTQRPQAAARLPQAVRLFYHTLTLDLRQWSTSNG